MFLIFLQLLFLTPTSVSLLSALCGSLIVIAATVLCHEARLRATAAADAKSPKASCLASAMPFCYPIVVGLLETFVQIAQKGGSQLLVLTASGASQLGEAFFWALISVWLLSSLLVVWWLRKGLANLAANRMLPVEYGTFTAASVLAGLVVYDEAQFVSSDHRLLMAGGVVLVIFGCSLVGSRRAVYCSMRCSSQEDEERLQAAYVRMFEA